ncbi:MAG: H-NS histone family protein [Candidatus Dactylopiibacterium sp.]|nr:H-NS histone family protein [Candidatus Dactylopiibacterium sp.]
MLLTKSQLGKATAKDLTQLADAIKAELHKRANNSKEKALKEVQAIAARHGVSLEALIGSSKPARSAKPARAARGKAAAKPRGKVPAKYAHPSDASQTWTGRGRKPKWVEEALNGGATLESLTIKA